MSEDPLWELAGPRLFAREVERAVRDRINVIIPTRDARMPTRLVEGITEYLTHRQVYPRVCSTDSKACIDVIRDLVETSSHTSLAEHCRSLGDVVMLVSVTETSAFSDWISFMSRWQDAARSLTIEARPCLIVVGIHPEPTTLSRNADVALKCFGWDTAMSLSDLESFALAKLRRDVEASTQRKLLARMVAEVSAGDVILAEHLCQLKPSEISLPMEPIKNWRNALEKSGAQVPESMWFEGEWHKHPAFPGNSSQVRQAIWRAQAAILLPWTDRYRQQALDRIRGRLTLRNAYNEPLKSADELEIGEIYYQLTSTSGWDSRIVGFYKTLREIRNRMAHRQPIFWDDLKPKLEQIEKYQFS